MEIAKLREVYKSNFDSLKGIKQEIENIQALQRKNVEQLEKDFLRYIKYKQQERETTISAVDSSLLASNIKDKEVQKHLESFMRARDEMRKK